MKIGHTFPGKEEVMRIRQQFPVGARVCLDQMSDQQAPPIGTLGTVIGVDAIGSIFVRWDNGSGLGVAYGEDKCHIVQSK